MSDTFPGTLTLTLEGDFGNLRFTIVEELMTVPHNKDNAVRNILTLGAKHILDRYNHGLGGDDD